MQAAQIPLPENLEQKAAAWDALVAVLNEVHPAWRSAAHGIRPIQEAAGMTVRQLSNAAEWGDFQTTKQHLRNELVVVKGIVNHPSLPAELKSALQQHLMRLARLV